MCFLNYIQRVNMCMYVLRDRLMYNNKFNKKYMLKKRNLI